MFFYFYTEEDLDCENPIEQSFVENIENIEELLYQGKGENCYIFTYSFFVVDIKEFCQTSSHFFFFFCIDYFLINTIQIQRL